MLKPFYTLIAFLTIGAYTYGQENLAQILNMQSSPKIYAAKKTQEPILIDGIANEAAWEEALWSDDFVDIEGNIKPKPRFDTKVKMLWDDKYLYIYAQLEEPHIWGTLTEHDAIIYHDNDFEVFIKPSEHQSLYYEIEVNALNTIMDLMMAKPYRLGGEAIMHWDVKNLKSAVHIEGTLNNPNDIDQYWSVEMAIPFTSISSFGRTSTPKVNDFWHINFSRVQWQHSIQNGQYKRKVENGKRLAEDNWVWSPIGIINMHYPEKWGYIQFTDNVKTNDLAKSHRIEQVAWDIYYLQQLYSQSTRAKYSGKLESLPGFDKVLKSKMAGIKHTITINKSKTLYKIELTDTNNHLKVTIDNFGNYTISDEISM
ncbi:Carbohydrate family 9 binding domain-like [Sphingobacterium nematocida]|uniref:Carbohydrate family 9 binding domain-like n=1 Tax=Sphingobacterium nematocida TaxID=1513896 RepID=A0A1T5FV20_9SPHI|nr:carbohydrate-binding family 9-like protein [Sphingobacterium nematocida]SKB99982.1 Carbohydrate family 9 binding domain-like [Sphingobacterium nematocida]